MSSKKSRHVTLMESHNETAAKLFVSSSNIPGYFGKNVGTVDRQDSQLQRRNIKIIEEILEDFDMDKTKEKYQNLSVIEYRLDPNNFGYDCSLSTIRVRQRLCKLMGTDVIRLNDRKYFETLSTRLQEEYESELNKEEDARAKKEEERLRKLMLEGVIKKPTDYRAAIMSDRKRKGKKKKKKSRKQEKETNRRTFSDNEDEATTEKEDVLTQIQVEGGSRPATATAASIRARSSKSSRPTDRAKSANSKPDSDLFTSTMFIKPPHHKSARKKPLTTTPSRKRVQSAMPWSNVPWLRGRGRMLDETDSHESVVTASSSKAETKSLPDLSRDLKTGTTKYSRQDPPLLRELKEEETVSGLYSLAEKLVAKRPTAAEEREMRRMRMPKPPKMST